MVEHSLFRPKMPPERGLQFSDIIEAVKQPPTYHATKIMKDVITASVILPKNLSAEIVKSLSRLSYIPAADEQAENDQPSYYIFRKSIIRSVVLELLTRARAERQVKEILNRVLYANDVLQKPHKLKGYNTPDSSPINRQNPDTSSWRLECHQDFS